MSAVSHPGLLFFLAVLPLVASRTCGQVPRLVADINRVARPTSSNPAAAVTLGSEVYFTAWTPATGTELYSAGVVLGSARVRADIVPGGGSSLPGPLVIVGKRLFFSAKTPETGRELYVFDTSLAKPQAVLVKDIAPGASDSALRVRRAPFHGI